MLVKVFRFLVVKHVELLWVLGLLSVCSHCDIVCDSLGNYPLFLG